MAAQHFIDCLFQQGKIQLSFNAECFRNVVKGAVGLQLVQEPQAFLGKGKRQFLVAGHRYDGRGLQAFFHPAGGLHKFRQPGHSGIFENLAQWHFHVQHLPQSGNQLGCQQGVPANQEEVVRHADLFHIQHLFPHFGDFFFQLIAGGHKGFVVVADNPVRFGQCFPVHFSVGGQGKLFQHHKGRRDHVIRQFFH